jgi:hypothetical protein
MVIIHKHRWEGLRHHHCEPWKDQNNLVSGVKEFTLLFSHAKMPKVLLGLSIYITIFWMLRDWWLFQRWDVKTTYIGPWNCLWSVKGHLKTNSVPDIKSVSIYFPFMPLYFIAQYDSSQRHLHCAYATFNPYLLHSLQPFIVINTTFCTRSYPHLLHYCRTFISCLSPHGTSFTIFSPSPTITPVLTSLHCHTQHTTLFPVCPSPPVDPFTHHCTYTVSCVTSI